MRSLAFIALAGAALGCGSAAPMASATPCTSGTATAVASDITLSGMSFVPSCAKVTAGHGITFTNKDTGVPHTVTTDAGQPETFDASLPTFDSTFVHTFAPTGETVHIRCTIHAGMTATILVE